MTTYTITSQDPNTTPFTVTEKTTVQMAVTAGSSFSSNEIITLQVDVGSSNFKGVSVRLIRDSLVNVELLPGTFRFSTSNTTPDTNIVLWVSPTT